MTPEETVMAKELFACKFVPGSWPKRFAGNMVGMSNRTPSPDLTKKQLRSLKILHHKYRRQIPSHQCGVFCRVEELAGSLDKR